MPWGSRPASLIIPSDLCCLGLARAFVEAFCSAAGFDRAATDAIILATNEAASNVVRHAHQERPDAQIQIVCRVLDDSMEICILDEGEPFDLASVPELDPAEIRVGGRGVFLMRSLMDEVVCEPRQERGNALKMVKRRGRHGHKNACS